MDQVDTGRMRRVLDRVYPPAPPPPEPFPPPPPEPGEDVCRLLNKEQTLYGTLQRAMRMSAECRRVLQELLRRCGGRERRLRSRCFLAGGPGPRPPEPRRRGEGVLSSLRRAERLLRELERDYRAAAETVPHRRELYLRFSRECARDEESVEILLEKALR